MSKRHRRAVKRSTKIERALNLLNEAAQEKRHELYEVLENHYEDFRSLLSEVGDKGRQSVENFSSQVNEAGSGVQTLAVQTAKKIKRTAHRRPWLIAAGIGTGVLVLRRLYR